MVIFASNIVIKTITEPSTLFEMIDYVWFD